MNLKVLGMYDREGRPVVRHTLCDACYAAEEPGRLPFRLPQDQDEPCCRCGAPTRSGIYYARPKDAYPSCAHANGFSTRSDH